MIEYDCEFFEDPIELRKRERAFLITNIIVENAMCILKILANNDFFEALWLLELHLERSKIEINAALREPLFPCMRGAGEIVCCLEDKSIIPVDETPDIQILKNNIEHFNEMKVNFDEFK